MVLYFTVKMPPVANIGDTLETVATISSNKLDTVAADNTFSIIHYMTGAFDPNDKTENHGGSITHAKAIAGEYLTYNIRFQNTGNDTTFNIYLRDTLDSKLDWNSLQIVASSHNYKVTMNDSKCLFTFLSIKLVDSLHNEPKSHVYIVYKIKPKPTVQIGDVIKNTAAIYFDYNLPVYTNTETTTIVAEVLPLKLLAFTAKKNDKINLLNWTTADEINVDRFDVERSPNGREFIKIGAVKAAASSLLTTVYSFTDHSPLTNNNYYRLKVLDKDGRSEYSSVRLISNNNSFSVSVYPNPAKDNLQVQVGSEKQTALQMQILSLDGKVLLSNAFSAAEGSSLRSITISALQKGSYLLKVISLKLPSEGRETNEESVVRFEKL